MCHWLWRISEETVVNNQGKVNIYCHSRVGGNLNFAI